MIVIININKSFREFLKAQCPALMSFCGPPSPRFLILSAHPAPYSLIEPLRKDKAECDARLRQRDSNMVGRQPPIPPRLRVRVPQTLKASVKSTAFPSCLTGANSHIISQILSTSTFETKIGSAEPPWPLETGCDRLSCCVLIAVREVST